MGKVEARPGPPEKVYLGLGSNLGNREANIRRVLRLLECKIRLTRVSSLYETEPWGYKDQPRFLNCACEGSTYLDPPSLLAAVKVAERQLGREPTFTNGPRVVDVDILFYGLRVIVEPGLQVPHPRLAERAFVLAPLAEIAGDYVHPVLGLKVSDLLRKLTGGVNDPSDLPAGVRMWRAEAP